MAAITEFPKIGSQPWKDMCLVFEENMIPIFKLDGGRYVHSGHQRQGPDMYERLACLNHRLDLQNLAEKAKNLVDEVTTRAPQFLEDDTEVVSPGGRREIIFIPRDPSEVTPRRAVFLGCVLTCLAVACIIGIGQYFGWWALLKQKCLTFWSYIRRNNDNSSATKDVLAIEAGIGKPEALETEVPEAIQNLELEAVEVDPQPEALGVDPRPSALEADAPPPAIEVEILEKIQGPPARLAICHEK